MVEVEEGHEGGLFWKALDGKNDYGSLQEGKRANTSAYTSRVDGNWVEFYKSFPWI